MQQSATEVKVTNQLKEEGIDKKELGREGFLERTLAVERRIWQERIVKPVEEAWDLPVTGTESVSQWTRDVLRQLKKYLSIYMKKDIFTKVPESSTGVRNVRLLFLMQR